MWLQEPRCGCRICTIWLQKPVYCYRSYVLAAWAKIWLQKILNYLTKYFLSFCCNLNCLKFTVFQSRFTFTFFFLAWSQILFFRPLVYSTTVYNSVRLTLWRELAPFLLMWLYLHPSLTTWGSPWKKKDQNTGIAQNGWTPPVYFGQSLSTF